MLGPKREVKETNTFQPSPDKSEGSSLCNSSQARRNKLDKPASPHLAQALLTKGALTNLELGFVGVRQAHAVV